MTTRAPAPGGPGGRPARRERRWIDAAWAALFAAGLALPPCATVGLLAGRDLRERAELPEGRHAAPFPPAPRAFADLQAFPRRLEAWYRDQLGGREVLLGARNALLVGGLRVAPEPSILPGRDGWLFWVGEGVGDDHRGLAQLPEGHLDLWVETLERRTRRLAELGVRYVFAVAPDKESIYADRLPPALRQLGPTTLDRLIQRLAGSSVEFVDLRPRLLEEKRHDAPGDWCYYACGTHWSPRGAWAAAQVLLERLRATAPAVTLDERADYLRPALPREREDSLSPRLLTGRLLDVPQADFVPARGFRAPATGVSLQALEDRVTELPDAGLPRVVLLHDSFGPFLQPFLAEHCARLRCRWTYPLPETLVAVERADVVIQVCVERALRGRPPPDFVPGRAVDPAEFLAAPDVAWSFARDMAARPAQGLRADRTIDLLTLPPLDVPPRGRVLLRIDATANAAANVDVYYTTSRQRTFARTERVQARLAAGRSTAIVELPTLDFGGRLALRPGSAEAQIRLEDLEVRWILSPAAPGGGAGR